MRSEAPITPQFAADLEAVLREQTSGTQRIRRPFAPGALRQLRSVSSMAGHVGAAATLSAVLLLLSPATLDREAQLPPISQSPVAGYLVQYGAFPNADQTITLARESGFEVEVVTTFVTDRASHGEIVRMQHGSTLVDTVPVAGPARGPLLIIIGLAIGDAGNTAD